MSELNVIYYGPKEYATALRNLSPLFNPIAAVEFLHLSLIKKKVEPKYRSVVVQGLFLLVLLFMTIAVYWYNYERFKKMMCKNAGAREPTFFIAFTAGAASGSVSIHFCF